MTDHEHTINRPDSMRTDESDSDEDGDEPKNETEIRRELRGNPIGEALLEFDRRFRQ